MSTLEDEHAWPPRGWPALKRFKRHNGQSLIKDPQTARVRGLNYTISSDRLHVPGGDLYIHHICVGGWEYTIQNDSDEFSVLSLDIMDRLDDTLPELYYMSNVKALSQSVVLDERSAGRTLNLLKTILYQVNNGLVPDIDHMMRLYRLHPIQLDLGHALKKTAEKWPPFKSFMSEDETR